MIKGRSARWSESRLQGRIMERSRKHETYEKDACLFCDDHRHGVSSSGAGGDGSAARGDDGVCDQNRQQVSYQKMRQRQFLSADSLGGEGPGLTPCSKCYGSASGGGSAASGGGSGSGGSGGSGSGSSEKSGSISVSASSLTLVRGSTKKLKVKGGSGTAKWSSCNKKVASVSADGEVTAKGKGKAVITVTRGGKKATCTVRVETPKLDMTEITLEIGETEFLELKGCSHAVEWTSSDEDVCDVCEGELIPVGEGTATVTAKVHGVRFRCEVTVVDPDEDFDDNV